MPPTLAGSRREVLDLLVAASGPRTVDDLAAALDLHPNSIRGALVWLTEEGFVDRATAPAAGRGRPGHLFSASVAAQAMLAVARAGGEVGAGGSAGSGGGGGGAGSGGGGEYRALAEAFAARLTSRADAAEEARIVGELWGRQVIGAAPARPLSDRTVRRRILQLLTDLGFGPEEQSSGESATAHDKRDKHDNRESPDNSYHRPNPSGATILLRTCPLLPSALRNPEVICAVHAGLIAGATGQLGGREEAIDLEPFAEARGCRLTLG